MALYAIGDLHLSFSSDKPMDVFGDNWNDYENKIKTYWEDNIKESDTVLIPGDISWAMRLNDALIDLEWIHKLPGRKILLRGNHDYWWSSLKKLQALFDDMDFLQNNFYEYTNEEGTFAICGTRGWLCPNPNKFEENDKKIYDRELLRLKLSLDAAKNAGHENFIVMTHYPPTNDLKERSGFLDIYEAYGVKKVIYGHLHSEYAFQTGLQGEHEGVVYQLTSCDYLNFEALKILD